MFFLRANAVSKEGNIPFSEIFENNRKELKEYNTVYIFIVVFFSVNDMGF